MGREDAGARFLLSGWGEYRLFALVAAALVVLQIYVPLYGRFEVTLWQILLFFALASSFVRGLPPMQAFHRPPLVALAVLIVGSALLIPTGSGGEPAFRTVAFLTLSVAAYLVGYEIAVEGQGSALLRAFVICALPVALANVFFFFLPSLELVFLQSPVARILVEPNTLEALFEPGLGNNVLAPNKAGTLFVNTNIGSIFFGFGTCVAIYLWRRRPDLRRALAAAAFLAAFLATGSRAGLGAALVTGLLTGLVAAWRLSAGRVLKWAGMALLLAAVVLSLPMSRTPLLRLAPLTVANDPRVLIWAHAAELIASHPLRGVGFDGWSASYAAYASAIGLNPAYPPHNAYMIAWLWLGIVGFAAMLLLVVGTLLSSIRMTARRWLLDLGLLGAALTSWFAVQLFFENFAVLEPRVGGSFFLLIGAIYGSAHYRRLQSAQARSRVQEYLPAALRGVAVQQPSGARAV